MSKKNLFISAVLTTFVLAVLATVAGAYKTFNPPLNNSQASTPVDVSAVASQPVQISYEQAAAAASSFLGQNDMYSIENAVWNGVNAYKVVFSSGHVVYVGLDGQILGSEAPQPVFVQAFVENPAPQAAFNNNNNSQGSSGEHESGEHESEDHD